MPDEPPPPEGALDDAMDDDEDDEEEDYDEDEPGRRPNLELPDPEDKGTWAA